MGITVLVVDDSMLIRQVVKKVIRQAGIAADRVLEADNGQQALDTLSGQSVDLVLSDINMPGMDGLEMLRRLRQDEAFKDLAVLMVSTEGSEETMQEAINLGANGYCLKPFTPESLAAQLRPLGLMPESGEDSNPDVDLSDPNAF